MWSRERSKPGGRLTTCSCVWDWTWSVIELAVKNLVHIDYRIVRFVSRTPNKLGIESYVGHCIKHKASRRGSHCFDDGRGCWRNDHTVSLPKCT